MKSKAKRSSATGLWIEVGRDSWRALESICHPLKVRARRSLAPPLSTTERMKTFRPICTIGIAGLATLVWLFPSLTNSLIYDRDAIVAGEIWRLWSGHLVHFSLSHFLFDVAAFVACGWFVETRTRVNPALLFLVGPPLISLAMLVLVPSMSRYGGLSALVVSALVCAALTIAKEERSWRWAGWTLLGLLAAKTGYELNHATALFASMPSIQVAPSSHLAGAAVAVIAWIVSSKQTWRATPR